MAETKTYTYEAFCGEHGVTEHAFGTCLRCMQEKAAEAWDDLVGSFKK